jgi:hypothetical protein
MAGLSFSNSDDADVFYTKISTRENSSKIATKASNNNSKNKKKKGKIAFKFILN